MNLRSKIPDKLPTWFVVFCVVVTFLSSLVFFFVLVDDMNTTGIYSDSGFGADPRIELPLPGIGREIRYAPVIEAEYTYETYRTCDGKTCTLQLGRLFAFDEDERWKPVENAASLLKSAFQIKFLREDKGLILEVIDFNLTHKTIELAVNSSYVGRQIPLTLYGRERNLTINVPMLSTARTRMTIESNISDELKFGMNSTYVYLTTADTQNLDDTYTKSSGPTEDQGTNSSIFLLNDSLCEYDIYIRFNTSGFFNSSVNIIDANLSLYVQINNLDNATQGFNVSTRLVYNNWTIKVPGTTTAGEWTEGNDSSCTNNEMCWNSRGISLANYSQRFNTTFVNNNTFQSDKRQRLNTTEIVALAKLQQNISIMIESHDVKTGTKTGEYIQMTSKEGTASERPYLNITYDYTISEYDTQAPLIDFISPTPPNDTTTINTSIQVNVSVSESNLRTLIYNWNGTNYSLYDDSLVLMMNFDNVSALGENNTYIRDMSRYNNNDTVIGAAWNQSGKYGGAYKFDGVDDYVNIPTLTAPTDKTYSLWINPGENTWVFRTLLEFGNDAPWFGLYNEGRQVQLYNNNPITAIDSIAPNGSWYHIVYTSDSASNVAKIYINGIQSGPNGTADTSTGVGLGIGRHIGEASFNGTIDEVRIWNRSLSDSEIYELYAGNLKKFNQTQWYLYVNQSKNATAGLDNGTYIYQVFASDLFGYSNQSGQRTITIGSVTEEEAPAPIFNISFIDPTPPNATVIQNTSQLINTSISAIYPHNVTAITVDWNGTNYTFINDSLVLYLNFDNLSSLGECMEVGCIARDLSRYGNNPLMITQAGLTPPFWTQYGKYGGAFQFVGGSPVPSSTGNMTNVRHSETLNPYNRDFAMAVWFNCTSCGDADIARKGSTNTAPNWYKLEIGGYGTPDLVSLQFNANGTDATLEWSTPVCDSKWHHAVAQRAGNQAELWVDGVKRMNNTFTGYINNSANLSIGSKDDLGTVDDFYNGTLDEFMLFMNRSLSASEIEFLYSSNMQKLDNDSYTYTLNKTSLAVGMQTYIIHASDTNNTNDDTGIRYLNVTAAPPVDSCSCPTSGNWLIDCSDNCYINSYCDMQGNDVHITGAGQLTITKDVNNTRNVFIHGCVVSCRGGCFK